MATEPSMQQGLLQFLFEWGGRREGAGRKPGSGRRRVAHRKKDELKKDCPLHITVRLRQPRRHESTPPQPSPGARLAGL